LGDTNSQHLALGDSFQLDFSSSTESVINRNVHFLQRHIDLDDAIYNFVKPHRALRRRLRSGKPGSRKWQQRTPAMVAGLTDHIWSLEELLMFRNYTSRGTR
jgi:hypothetical protein